jgi:hypothetical protein
MDREALVKGLLGGKTSKYPLSAQTVPMSVANASKTDPAMMWPGSPPNWGQPDMPHIFSFVGRYGMVANAYMQSDEALMHSSANAEIMRNEPMIMECVEARMRCVALLNWHIQPVDNDVLRDALDKADSQETAMRIRAALKKPKSDAQVMADKLTSILKHTPHFMKMRYALMDAIWYGKTATVQTMGVRPIGGQRRIFVRKWEPRHGDKLIFRYADGSYEYDPDQVGIRIGPTTEAHDDKWVDYAGFERSRVDATQHGFVYWFDGQQRRRICLHKHIIEDGDFMRPEKAGSINGVGIRSRIYWTWWAYQESLKLLLEYVERSALGIEIWKYPAHDPKAKERTEKAAQERGAPGRSVVLVPIPTGEYGDMYGVQIVEPGLGGISELQSVLQTFFGHKIKRYILGQTLTSEAEATGMGSGVADAHLATFHDIVRFDGLNLEETITTDLLRPLQQWNFPGTDDIFLRFVIDTESPDAQERIASYQAAWAMGVKIRTEDIYDALGASPPTEGDDFLDNPGLESARISNEAQKQQIAQQAMMMQAQMGGGQAQQFVPFPDMGEGGVPGDGDGDGLANDQQDQLFDDRQMAFQSNADVERYSAHQPAYSLKEPAYGEKDLYWWEVTRYEARTDKAGKLSSNVEVETQKSGKLPELPYHPDALDVTKRGLPKVNQTAVQYTKVGPEHARSAVPILTGKEQLSVPTMGKVSKKTGQATPKALHVAQAINNRSTGRGGVLHLHHPEHHDFIAKQLADEALHAIKSNGGGTGWYDRQMKGTMRYVGRMFPQIKSDRGLATAFKAILAVTSGGTDVMKNFGNALDQFDHYLKTYDPKVGYGQFNHRATGGGKQQKAIRANIKRLNGLIQEYGQDGLRKFLLSKSTVGELLKKGYKANGELRDHTVYNSAVFGPKIGAFFANLHGKYDPVTMDMWWMRTVNRLRGTLTKYNPDTVRQQAGYIHNALLHTSPYEKDKLHGYKRNDLIRLAKHVHRTGDLSQAGPLKDWALQRYKAFATSTNPATGEGSFHDRNHVNNAARNFYRSFFEENLKPENGMDRHHMRKLAEKVQFILGKRGHHITNAELQATLWYHEKNLWRHLGYVNTKAEPMSFLDAAKAHFKLRSGRGTR